MSTEPNKSEFLPRLRYPKFPAEDAKGEFLPRLRTPKIPDEPAPPKTARACPWGHPPMWVINGDWDNPDVRCSDPNCPASGKEVSLAAWNAMEPAPPQPEPPTDTERAHAFEWLRKLGLDGTSQEARLAYVAMQTMLMADPTEPQAEALSQAERIVELSKEVGWLRHKVHKAQAEAKRVREQSKSLIMAMETVRLDRKLEDDGNVWALQTLEWAEWLVEKATEARASLKEGQG